MANGIVQGVGECRPDQSVLSTKGICQIDETNHVLFFDSNKDFCSGRVQ